MKGAATITHEGNVKDYTFLSLAPAFGTLNSFISLIETKEIPFLFVGKKEKKFVLIKFLFCSDAPLGWEATYINVENVV